jgi:ESCRT-II complex subunit VPS36
MSRIQNLMRKKIDNQNKMISGSFNDIQSLRENAEAMISLAQQIRAKLSTSQANNNEKASQAAEINSVLSKIGFVDPVTKEVAGSDYYIKLAEQINLYFTDYFKKNPDIKVITLIDAYCIYNRARGGNTISPKDMTQAINNFHKVAGQIQIKNFNKEMIVLHTNEFSNENLINLITNYMNENKQDYIDLNSLSKIINVKNVLLETILIEDLLNNGLLLIDEFDLDVRYYLNKILNYNIK